MTLTSKDAINALIESIAKAGAFNHFSALFVTKVIASARDSSDQSLVHSMPGKLPLSWALASEVALLYLRNHHFELSIQSAASETQNPLTAHQSSAEIRTTLRYPSSSQVIRELMHTFAVRPRSPLRRPIDGLISDEDDDLVTQHIEQVHMRDIGRDLQGRFSVTVIVLEASDIPRHDLVNSVDPFCVLQFEGEDRVFRTRTEVDTQTPKWEQAFEFSFRDRRVAPVLTIALFDDDELSDPLKLAQIAISLPMESGETEDTFHMTPVAVSKNQAILTQPALRLRFITIHHPE
jgi:hypothetical protein